MLRYTTIANIAQRLNPRIKVNMPGDDQPDAFGRCVLSQTLIDDQIGPQVEARADAVWEKCGLDPSAMDPLLRQGIIEKLICCEALRVHFIGDDVSDDPYAQLICQQAEKELLECCPADNGNAIAPETICKPARTYVSSRKVDRCDPSRAENIRF